MKKFLVLFKASASGFAEMMKSTPEQKKAGMEGWMAWMKKAAPSIVDMGAPLGKSVHFDKNNAAGAPVSNGLGRLFGAPGGIYGSALGGPGRAPAFHDAGCDDRGD